MKHSQNKGFTLLEAIISIAIISSLAGLSVVAYSSFSQREALNAAASTAAAMLRDARAQTIASVGGSQYGVLIEPTRYVLFRGASYDVSSPHNQAVIFSSRVRASSSQSSFVFERVTGDASASGIIEVYLASDPSTKKTVVVQGTGLVSIE
ncbi:MAG: prepilin-type N-terminal cleavage/methylation domain-containing protein [bacterium]|nr:prepilin-type N-terminal cleavage/methylation domain-containing protein [bacterium]